MNTQYKTGVWLNREDHEERKKEQKQLQNIRKKDIEVKQYVHNMVTNIFKNIIVKQKEEVELELRSRVYIRAKIRFRDGKRIPRLTT